MFRDIIFIKSDLISIYKKNKLKGYIYYKIYNNKIKKLMKRIYDSDIDTNLLKEIYEFFKLTKINLYDKFKDRYQVDLYSDGNSIKFIISSDINFTITVTKDDKINIIYCEGEYTRYLFEMEKYILNIDERDQTRYQILSSINEKILDIITFSIELYFTERNRL